MHLAARKSNFGCEISLTYNNNSCFAVYNISPVSRIIISYKSN